MTMGAKYRGVGRIALGWSLAGAALATTPAMAQSPAAGAASDEDTIIVTAQPRSERLGDVPALVQTIDGEARKTAQIIRFQDLQIVSPSVQVGRTGTQNQPAIRGVTTTFAGGGQETNIAVYVD